MSRAPSSDATRGVRCRGAPPPPPIYHPPSTAAAHQDRDSNPLTNQNVTQPATTPPPPPRARALALDARRLLVPAHLAEPAYVSFPVPVMRNSTLTAVFFAAPTVARADGANEDMYAPTVELTLDWATGRQLDLRVLRPGAPQPGEVPAVEVRPLIFQDRMSPELQADLDRQSDRLHTLLDAAVIRYGVIPQRPPSDDGTRYLEQWEDLVPHAARTYYIAFNPDFFSWIERGR